MNSNINTKAESLTLSQQSFDDRNAFQQLLDEVLDVKKCSNSFADFSNAEVSLQLIQVLVEAGLLPFLDKKKAENVRNSLFLRQAEQSLDALLLVITAKPALLNSTKSSIVFLEWLFPRTIFLYSLESLIPIYDKLCGFHLQLLYLVNEHAQLSMHAVWLEEEWKRYIEYSFGALVSLSKSQSVVPLYSAAPNFLMSNRTKKDDFLIALDTRSAATCFFLQASSVLAKYLPHSQLKPTDMLYIQHWDWLKQHVFHLLLMQKLNEFEPAVQLSMYFRVLDVLVCFSLKYMLLKAPLCIRSRNYILSISKAAFQLRESVKVDAEFTVSIMFVYFCAFQTLYPEHLTSAASEIMSLAVHYKEMTEDAQTDARKCANILMRCLKHKDSNFFHALQAETDVSLENPFCKYFNNVILLRFVRYFYSTLSDSPLGEFTNLKANQDVSSLYSIGKWVSNHNQAFEKRFEDELKSKVTSFLENTTELLVEDLQLFATIHCSEKLNTSSKYDTKVHTHYCWLCDSPQRIKFSTSAETEVLRKIPTEQKILDAYWRWTNHSNTFIALADSDSGKRCLQMLFSSVRMLRMSAGRILPRFFSSFYTHEDIVSPTENRIMILETLKNLASGSHSKFLETTIMAWAHIAEVAEGEELHLILLQLIEFIVEGDTFHQGVAVSCLHNVARRRDVTIWQLFSPYWRTVCVMIIKSVTHKPGIVKLFAETMGITDNDFLTRTQAYTVPYLVLTKNRAVIQKIAEASHNTVSSLCLSNMPKILATFLTSESANVEESVMLLLTLASSDFEKIDLSRLLRSDPISVTVELLQLCHKEAQVSQVINAITKVAILVSPSLNEKNVNEETLLLDFFNNHILGILAEFSNIINNLRGKASINEKTRTIIGMKEMIQFAGSATKLGLPQITSCLQSAFQDNTLRSYALEAWLALLLSIDGPEYLSLASLSLVLLPSMYPKISKKEKIIVVKVIDYIAKDPMDNIEQLRPVLPVSFASECFSETSRDSFSKIQVDDFHLNIEDIMQCCRNEHESVCLLGLQKLASYLQTKEAFLQSLITVDVIDPLINRLLRCLLDCCLKFAHSNDEISFLAAKNLGILGAIDPNRADAQKRIGGFLMLDNFENGEECLKFITRFIQDQLIPAFITTTDTKAQSFLAYALQELLHLGGFRSAVIGSQKRSTKSVEAQYWNSLPDSSKRVLIPFLNSKYHLTSSLKPRISFPIYSETTTFTYWIQSFCLKLMQYYHSKNADRIFSICAKVIKDQETSISRFLFPFLLLNAVLTESADELKLISTELKMVVFQKRPERTNRESMQRYTTFLKCFFEVVDYFNNWLRARRRRSWEERSAKARRENRYMSVDDAVSEEATVVRVDSFLSQFPVEKLGLVSLFCGFHARALFYWEQHLRMSKEKTPSSVTENDYRILQEIYSGIDDPDGIEAISFNFHNYSLDQQIILHENSENWDSALTCYELSYEKQPKNDILKVGMLNCLLQAGHYESVINNAKHISSLVEEPSRSTVLNLAIEAAWSALLKDKLQELVTSSSSVSFDTKVGRLFLNYLSNMHDQAEFDQLIRTLYTDATIAIANTGANSSYDCYDILSKLHAIHDFSVISSYTLSKTPIPEDVASVFKTRLECVVPYGKFKQRILSAQLVGFSRGSKNSVYQAPTHLEIAKLARKNQQMQRAYNSILRAMSLNKAMAAVEHSRWWWHQGQRRKAIAELQSSFDASLFESADVLSMHSISALSSTSSNESKGSVVKGKALLTLTKWLGEAGQLGLKDLEVYYYKAVNIYPEWEKSHYYLAHHRVSMLEEEKKLPPGKKSEKFLTGELVTRIINEYGRSLYYGTKHIYESMPKLLTLWLDFGAEELQLSEEEGDSYFREHIIASRKKSLELINSNIVRLGLKIPQYLFLTALSQMISRICHPNQKVYRVLEHLISLVISAYPKETLWQLMAATKSTSHKRSVRGKSILNLLYSKKKNQPENLEMKKLCQSAVCLTDKLLDLCNVRLDTRAVKLSLKGHFRISLNSPVDLVIPAQSFMNITLPSKGIVYHQYHPFPNNQPTIEGFEDEVDIMNSLQKPRKVTIRGTNGKMYHFLCKPKDDLRKDARLMELNNVINKILRKDQAASRRKLNIRTYVVIPLNEECGFIEWVNNTRPFRDILLKIYKQKNVPIPYQELRANLDMALQTPNPAKIFEEKILPRFPSVFHEWFMEAFPEPSSWVKSRQNYSRTLAVMSMVGYVLGLGDRHGENILFDELNGDAIHVDFNCLFEKGLTFAKPEKVPFRLTHNMVDAMGPTGYEGSFRKSSEITMRLLRSNQNTLMSVLESFLYDPLVEWNRRGQNSLSGGLEQNEATQVLAKIRRKLQGYIGEEPLPLSVEGQVQELIKEAVSSDNLVQMYIGWAAYF
ncbi:ATR checkpoint kinase Rad3 [Schizosaccharomyces japonicus yFS275]|uniref:non-specific serine/threonine protein kinase n=1 Tax=Schizosaccharomyces japonicus (strain yFS275 / FY16936) TaxID=402676 RepID=B6JVF4_SCHJY|nr:ATR checkpoint kinase Rad3 [Schizosaccharomyces japonicus yFS275]EEB05355.1 ATR checkpoint kinase Rad3 [Schizosaccharomyces japonicus yFS275]